MRSSRDGRTIIIIIISFVIGKRLIVRREAW